MKLFIDKNVTPNSVLLTDQFNTYQELQRHGDSHVTGKTSKETTANLFEWAHIAISNTKRMFQDVYHKISATTYKTILRSSIQTKPEIQHRFVRLCQHCRCFSFLVQFGIINITFSGSQCQLNSMNSMSSGPGCDAVCTCDTVVNASGNGVWKCNLIGICNCNNQCSCDTVFPCDNDFFCECGIYHYWHSS